MTSREQGKRIAKELEDYEKKFDLGQVLPDDSALKADPRFANKGIGDAAKFPARYLYPDDRDKKYALRRQLNARANRPDPITDEELDYLLDKTYGYETAEFHRWFSMLYQMDDANPIMKKWGMELVPELWQMKEKSIDDNAKLQAQLAKIKLRGIRSREDLLLMYGIARKQIEVPKGPIYAPDDVSVYHKSKRGIFNPRHMAGTMPGIVVPNGAQGYIDESAGNRLPTRGPYDETLAAIRGIPGMKNYGTGVSGNIAGIPI